MSTTEIESGAVASTNETGSGLDENVAGALSYLFGAITGVIFFVVDKENAFVRFHAAQSIVLSVGAFVAFAVLGVIGTIVSTVLFAAGGSGAGFALFGLFSLLMTLLWSVVGLGLFAVWIYLMFRTYQGETVRIPLVAGFADRFA
jgi:uncharacterized membrane protein